MAHPDRYSILRVILHWITGESMGDLAEIGAEAAEQGATVATGTPPHAIIGLAVLALVALRLIVRGLSGVPAPLPAPAWQQAASTWAHRAPYALMILVPVSGMMAFFGGVEPAGDAHGVLFNLLLVIAGVHAAAALVHHFVQRNRSLMRMLGR
ncbi:cytochrome b [Paracoccus sp. (in: a-proteobacteria)]|uniref:cytochrome b n=1 Tax=Paracoccus sp. TaxID=267 RepID=UPI0026DFDAB9|nr:cytochrome b/b6 domain-containing protein [Paracoccus sp. (in: a-proteobacteria)]MDO5648520.1 cytochrome b/b6 domain-containing protein [Paracoccus sp. (in: a-proteobacteria)]